MKRMVALLLALMLPVCAVAEMLTDRLGAPLHVTENYLSATGKQAYVFDAQVDVPDAQKVSIYAAQLRSFTTEEARLAAESCFAGAFVGDETYFVQEREPSVYWTMHRTQQTLYYESEEMTAGIPRPDGNALWPLSTLTVENNVLENGHVIEAVMEYQGLSEMTTLYEQNENFALYSVMNETGIQMTRHVVGVPRDCTMPLEAARAKADAIVTSFAPDLTRTGEGIRPNLAGTREAYVFFYTDNRYDMPYTFTSDLPFSLNDFAVHAPAYHAVLVLSDKGVEYLQCASPTEITVLEKDVHLMPFEQILSIAKSMLPLVYAHWEANEAFYTVKVERITLGYMRVLDRDNPEQVLVIPVWDFFGRADKDDGTSVPRYDEPGATLLTLNAIDGTVIDRTYGY